MACHYFVQVHEYGLFQLFAKVRCACYVIWHDRGGVLHRGGVPGG
jgi:hypothetical protein